MGVAAPWALVGAWSLNLIRSLVIGQLQTRNQILHKYWAISGLTPHHC